MSTAQQLMMNLNWTCPKLSSSRLQTSSLHREPQRLCRDGYPTHLECVCEALCRMKASLTSFLYPCMGYLAGMLSLVYLSLGPRGGRTLDGHCLGRLVLTSLSSVLTANRKAMGVSGSHLLMVRFLDPPPRPAPPPQITQLSSLRICSLPSIWPFSHPSFLHSSLSSLTCSCSFLLFFDQLSR